jgi:hypothetical protein
MIPDKETMQAELRFSSAQAIALCPGRVRAAAGVPRLPSGPFAERGTSRHAVLSAFFTGNDAEYARLYDELEDDDQGMVDILREKTEEVIAEYGGLDGDPPRVLCEAAFEAAGWSGHPDFMAVCADEETILLLDWKGPGSAPPTEINAQLRGYFLCAVQAAEEAWGLAGMWKRVIAAIVAPFDRVVPVEFREEDAAKAESELIQIRMAAFREGAPRIPGPLQCQYCPALGTARCPESYAMGMQIMANSGLNMTQARPEWLVSVVKAGAVVAGIVKRASEEIQRRVLEEPGSVPGARMEPGTSRRTITQPLLAVERAVGTGKTSVASLIEAGALKPVLGKLEKALGKKDSPSVLEGCVEKKESSERLVIE